MRTCKVKKKSSLTDNAEAPHFSLGLCGVDLTHVLALVGALDALDVEVPGLVGLVADADPGIAGDHVVLNGQDGGPVLVDPRDLFSKIGKTQWVKEKGVNGACSNRML